MLKTLGGGNNLIEIGDGDGVGTADSGILSIANLTHLNVEVAF